MTLIGRGQWIDLPPTPAPGGSTRWIMSAPERPSGLSVSGVASPEVMSLRGLPHSLHVQWAALRALTVAARRFNEVDESVLGAQLRQEYEAGVTVAELARRLARSPKYVHRLLRTAGTVFRPAQRNLSNGRDDVVWSKTTGRAGQR